uniref:Uncharacterized protein n=1 Tax=Anguilla anguilla TaxID=7936 RepID=A0A0E9Q1K4_ANGAN
MVWACMAATDTGSLVFIYDVTAHSNLASCLLRFN